MWGKLREKRKVFDNFSVSLKAYDIFRFGKYLCIKNNNLYFLNILTVSSSIPNIFARVE